MEDSKSTTLKLKVTPGVARLVKPGASRESQLLAAQGKTSLAEQDLLTALLFFCHGQDKESRTAAIKTLNSFPNENLRGVLSDPCLHPQIIDLIARIKKNDLELTLQLIKHPALPAKTLNDIVKSSSREALEKIINNLEPPFPENFVQAAKENPECEEDIIKIMTSQTFGDELESEGLTQEEIEALMLQAEQENLSKFQISLELKVAEKIKLGLTGDKEWRSLMIKQPNKLIQSAVLKNPRITEGEVLMIANNKSTSEDLVRIILLNKDWMKNYEIKKSLISHPKTPPAKAMRLVPYLITKDLKNLVKSRQVSSLISNAARKELDLRLKKMGG
jgi:uncharacterized protein YneF (UPF0154 family)